ncbi:hypothetical protein CFR73_03795 [Novacetimonas maltaceti]|uniref:UrcA family protein n=1 Tax=Novacetimonas maltaceti TaxID=1203393 RepID=A0A2S3W4D2_9PROT|nr:hypothetical protein [Novacetimonas maltaceti]POF63668.1 hypothetical protein KMAL_06340 [Novacetimonas maltaceti]PYD61206.1 hypothetical protein CFR73_03795 [Novacetimonas maltaceti]
MNIQPVTVPAFLVMSLCLCGHSWPVAAAAPVTQAPPSQAGGDSNRPVIITSDTPAFCNRLIGIIDAYGPGLPHDIDDLRAHGADLCREGRVRSGIIRLRRALVELKETTHS